MSKRDMAVRWHNTGDLTPHPNNPRRHSDAQLEQIYASVSRFGWANPILIDENSTVLAGHGRLEMAKRNKMRQVPTIQITGLSEEEKRAFILADNRTAENGEWDVVQLLNEIDFLSEHAIEADTLGFSDADILGYHSMVDDTGFTEPVESPSIPNNSATTQSFDRPIESSTEPTQLQSNYDGAGNLHPGAEAAASLVPFSLMLAAEDRERVFAVLNRVRGEDRTMAEALMIVVDAFDAQCDPEEEETDNG